MSGGLSIPFAFIALLLANNPEQENHQEGAISFTVLAFIAIWILVIRMAYANYKRTDKTSVNRELIFYFKQIDERITLLKYYKREGATAENITKAGDIVIESGELFEEIGRFIKEKIGPIDATLFSAGNDLTKLLENDDKTDFFDSISVFLKKRLIKLKEIMERQI